MKKIIVPTGYMGSGSSAITDFISEIEGYDADKGTFEYVFLHCPNGVFDLEDKLLKGNNAVRSDEALHSFKKTMKQLYNKKYWWVGHYSENMSPRFMQYTEEYIASLIQYKPDFYWYYQENADWKMIFKLVLKKVMSLISLGKIKMKKPLIYDEMVLSYVGEREFYEKTKEYLKKLWIDMGIEESNIILDQLLLPFNLFRFPNYFDKDSAEVFVVDRDPRDVFIINKYIWSKRNEPVPYPTDVEEFCKCYKALRGMEQFIENENIHRVHFEDLIYCYPETSQKILRILKAESHNARSKFVPEKSIENTQLFLADSRYKEEANYIEEHLKDYLYEFPYERIPNSSKTF